MLFTAGNNTLSKTSPGNVVVNILVLDREQRGANGDFDENGEQSPNS